MTTIADRIAGPPPAAPADAVARDTAAAAPAVPAISLPAGAERELRLDLFRGLALWLIFIDHLPPNLLTWFTIRNYGFSDATEIFIFISGYTAAFVYGRAMLERRRRHRHRAHPAPGLADLRRPRLPVHDLPRPRSPTSRPASRTRSTPKRWEIMDFLKQPDVTIVQALLLRFRPVNMDALPLYIVLMLALPLILWLMKWRPDVTLGL